MTTPCRLLVAFALIVTIPSAAGADIRGETRGQSPSSGGGRHSVLLRSGLNGSIGEALIDIGQLGWNLFSLWSGESAVLAALFGGPVPPVAIRIQAAVGAVDEFRQMLTALSDKTVAEGGRLDVSTRAGGRATVTFRVTSDDDPFGRIMVLVHQSAGITVRTFGQGTKSGGIDVTFDASRVAPGIYPVLMIAKEDDCNVCLAIQHTVIVYVYEPCPGLLPVCVTANRELDLAADAYTAQVDAFSNRTFRPILDRDRTNRQRVAAKANACGRLWFFATGSRANDNRDDPNSIARRNANRCDEEYERLRAQLEGACPDVAFGASPAECETVRNRQRLIAQFRERLNAGPIGQSYVQAAARSRFLDCCDELRNPDGGRGRGPLPRPNVTPPRTDDARATPPAGAGAAPKIMAPVLSKPVSLLCSAGRIPAAPAAGQPLACVPDVQGNWSWTCCNSGATGTVALSWMNHQLAGTIVERANGLSTRVTGYVAQDGRVQFTRASSAGQITYDLRYDAERGVLAGTVTTGPGARLPFVANRLR